MYKLTPIEEQYPESLKLSFFGPQGALIFSQMYPMDWE